MNLEERFKASKDNITTKKYSGQSSMLSDTSRLNVDAIPAKYDTKSRLATKGPKASKFDIDIIPSKYAPK